MKNESNVYQKKVNQFERGGKVLSDSLVDNDEKIGAPDLTKHLKNHRVLGTARLGQLMPVSVLQCLAHDDYRVKMSNTVQFQPLNKPILDKLITKMHSFYVGYHCIYGDQFEMFWKGGKDGSFRRELPYYDLSNVSTGTIRSNHPSVNSGDVVLAVALLSWAISHHMTFNQVVEYASFKPSELVGWRWIPGRIQLILQTVFGKGSLLDMFNLGVGEFNFSTSERVDLTFKIPTMIPIDRLLAYKLICNDFYRIADYQNDMFDNVDYPHSALTDFSKEIVGKGGDEPEGGINLDVEMPSIPFGYICRHLDKLDMSYQYSQDGQVRGYDCHFFPSASLSISGVLSPGAGIPSTSHFFMSHSLCMLAWLLAIEPVPVAKDYLSMILPRTQRGLVSGLGSLPLNAPSNVPLSGIVTVHQNNSPRNLVLRDNNIIGLGTEGPSLRGLFTSLDMDTIRYINAATKLAEKMNLVGEDYGQQLLAEFGINPKHANIDKPLYLGGLTSTPRVEKVTSVSDTKPSKESENGSFLGQFVGDASQFATGSFNFIADDHGLVITIMSTVPETSYARFIDRDAFAVFDRMNWFRKEFEDLTEQHLYVNEFKGIDTKKLAQMIAGRVAPTDSDVIGYVPREQQRRQIPSTVHGELIPSVGTQDNVVWTATRDFNEVNELSTLGVLFNSVENPENRRLFQLDQVEFPPLIFECGFNVDVLSTVGRITLPITI